MSVYAATDRTSFRAHNTNKQQTVAMIPRDSAWDWYKRSDQEGRDERQRQTISHAGEPCTGARPLSLAFEPGASLHPYQSLARCPPAEGRPHGTASGRDVGIPTAGR